MSAKNVLLGPLKKSVFLGCHGIPSPYSIIPIAIAICHRYRSKLLGLCRVVTAEDFVSTSK